MAYDYEEKHLPPKKPPQKHEPPPKPQHPDKK